MPRRVEKSGLKERLGFGSSRFLSPVKNHCQKYGNNKNNSGVISIDEFHEIMDIVLESLPVNGIRKLWTRNIAINSTYYYDDFGTYEFSR